MIGEAGHPVENKRGTTDFAVLRHEDREGTHYDLMIDMGGHLATWKSREPPETAQSSPLACRRIGDHRRVYLDYEGPVSGDRGEVRRYDRGRCTIVAEWPDRWRVRFHGEKLEGCYEFSRIADDSWQCVLTGP